MSKIKQCLMEYNATREPYPIVMSFHDVRLYTDCHTTAYLHMHREEATRIGFALSDRTFFDACQAALFRFMPPPSTPHYTGGTLP
jgi:hypothetical protein